MQPAIIILGLILAQSETQKTRNW